jgi:hypothetical protein
LNVADLALVEDELGPAGLETGDGRRTWAALLFPEVEGIAGPSNESLQLHWTRRGACFEAEGWVGQSVAWLHLDPLMSIAHLHHRTLIVRAILLPTDRTPIDEPLSEGDRLRLIRSLVDQVLLLGGVPQILALIRRLSAAEKVIIRRSSTPPA